LSREPAPFDPTAASDVAIGAALESARDTTQTTVFIVLIPTTVFMVSSDVETAAAIIRTTVAA
jgi:hypothetical protein